METFKAKIYDNTELVLEKKDDLETVWDLLEANENFIITYPNADKKTVSEVVIASDVLPKIKNTEIKLLSEE